MPEGRSDAITELVHILREQLARKDAQIAALEGLLRDASRRIAGQQAQLALFLNQRPIRSLAPSPESAAPAPALEPSPSGPDSAAGRPAPAPPAQTDDPVVPGEPVTVPAQIAPPPRPEPRTNGAPERVPLPDLGPQIQVIARAVVAAAAERNAREPADDGVEITARFDRAKLRKGHEALAGGRRGLWRWPRRGGA